jgi:serine/threonine protein kinase
MIEESEASSIAYKIVKALMHCHSSNIMHRDIKPENIVFDANGEPKLTDFGFALYQEKKCSWNDTVGSPLYMSPEMLYGKYGQECDVWSLGVVIYFMLTGDYPFEGETIAETNKKISFGSFIMPTHVS